MHVLSRVRFSATPRTSPLGSSVHGISQARILGVDCHSLLQGIFPTQGSKPISPALASGFFTSSATEDDEEVHIHTNGQQTRL